jgi:ribose 5-phosphate isomerase B
MKGEMKMKIVMGSDHTGYELKLSLKKHIEALGHTVTDVGSHSSECADYPVFGKLAAGKISIGEADLAVLICGTGFGISLAANKVKGIRCVNCTEPYTAQLSRKHNNANALALGARVVGVELAKMIVDIFLSSSFEGGRHADRIAMIE